MLNPAVPVIGPKVTVVGSKVTEMLKRKLQQRLLADKAKKVKTSLSEDEKEALLASGSCSNSSSSSIAAASLEHPIFVQANSIALTSCPSSNNFAAQNGFRVLDSNKGKVSKAPKSSKSKKCLKTSAAQCTGINAGTFVIPSTGATAIGTCSIGTPVNNTITGNNSTVQSPEFKKSCLTLTLNSTNVDPRHIATNQQQSSIAFKNGRHHLLPGITKPNLPISFEDKKTGFNLSCMKKFNMLSSCNSACETGLLPGNVSSGDLDGCLISAPTLDAAAAEKLSTEIATNNGMTKMPLDGGDGPVLQKLQDGHDAGIKKSSGSDAVNSSLIDSSLWPLIYGENSKQLDEYIHRIYCRDCQKSQEQRPLGEKADGDTRHLMKPAAAGMQPPQAKTKCQLQCLKEFNEMGIYNPVNHEHDSKIKELDLPAEQIDTVLPSDKSSPAILPKEWKPLNVFHAQNGLQAQNNDDRDGFANPDAVAGLPSVTSASDRSKVTDKDVESAMSKPSSTLSIGTHANFANLNDNRTKKKKVPTATLR